MKKVKSKKILTMLMLALTLFSTLSPIVFATEISSANIQNRGNVEHHYNIGMKQKMLGIM